MQITKLNLLADKEALQNQIMGLQATLHYINGLLSYVDKEEKKDETAVNE